MIYSNSQLEIKFSNLLTPLFTDGFNDFSIKFNVQYWYFSSQNTLPVGSRQISLDSVIDFEFVDINTYNVKVNKISGIDSFGTITHYRNNKLIIIKFLFSIKEVHLIFDSATYRVSLNGVDDINIPTKIIIGDPTVS